MREHLDRDIDEPTSIGSGASVTVDDSCWAYFPEHARGVLGATLVWAQSQGASQTNLITDESDGLLAFTAGGFSDPEPIIWHAVERSIVAVGADVPEIPGPPDCPESTAILAGLDLEVVADHGVWLGDLNGLEVARVGLRGDECEVDIGVGAYDQFASAALSVDRDEESALANVVSMVRPHRLAGSDPHPIGRLVRSRWLRSQIIADPQLAGLKVLHPIPLLVPRPGLVESQPAAGLGEDSDGRKVLLIASTGIDLGVVETAAGLSAYTKPDRIVVVMPARDHHPRIVQSLTTLAVPAELVALEGEWSD